ncbi:thioredoxin family protein [Flavobacterium soyangense]|uniref:Thioredoxin family protein n=1 Tax=Flavobacterium soyangense TaxID=2023265 RepID=A0A930UEE6_9FLAO|nr:thioredoxin family protein [Flavobacterium soyangense]MBF2709796.1 thioredoxin family protein [Flavobacterium soyangense]
MDTNALTTLDYKQYFREGILYAHYKEQMAMDFISNTDVQIQEYILLNQSRMRRLDKTYTPSKELQELLQNLNHKTYWLVLTEHWCGDASQTLPVLNKIAELSQGKIELRLVYRDQNLDLMDAHLTKNGRAIPKLIQLNEHFSITGIWGPRPNEAQDLVNKLKANPETATTYAGDLHLWHARNKQQAMEKEVSKLIFKANLFCPDCLS